MDCPKNSSAEVSKERLADYLNSCLTAYFPKDAKTEEYEQIGDGCVLRMCCKMELCSSIKSATDHVCTCIKHYRKCQLHFISNFIMLSEVWVLHHPRQK